MTIKMTQKDTELLDAILADDQERVAELQKSARQREKEASIARIRAKLAATKPIAVVAYTTRWRCADCGAVQYSPPEYLLRTECDGAALEQPVDPRSYPQLPVWLRQSYEEALCLECLGRDIQEVK